MFSGNLNLYVLKGFLFVSGPQNKPANEVELEAEVESYQAISSCTLPDGVVPEAGEILSHQSMTDKGKYAVQ